MIFFFSDHITARKFSLLMAFCLFCPLPTCRILKLSDFTTCYTVWNESLNKRSAKSDM